MQEAAVAIPGCFLFWDIFLVPGMTGWAIRNSRKKSDIVGTISGFLSYNFKIQDFCPILSERFPENAHR